MILIKRKFDSQTIPMKEMKLKIKEVIKYLEEANLILSKEPEYSAERQMAKAAEEALANLKR